MTKTYCGTGCVILYFFTFTEHWFLSYAVTYLYYTVSLEFHFAAFNFTQHALSYLRETWKAYRILVRKSPCKCALGRPRRWAGNINKLALREMSHEQDRWAELAQDNVQ
jgi:hypothetical protein